MMKWLLLMSLWLTFLVSANLNVYDFNDQIQEQRFSHLIQELRCPKCQNNNLADSNAPLARDIKNYVYHSVKSGQSDEEITSFLISRYGEFITYRPRNWVVWALPTALGMLALGVALLVIRHKRYQFIVLAKEEKLPDMKDIIKAYEQEQQL